MDIRPLESLWTFCRRTCSGAAGLRARTPFGATQSTTTTKPTCTHRSTRSVCWVPPRTRWRPADSAGNVGSTNWIRDQYTTHRFRDGSPAGYVRTVYVPDINDCLLPFDVYGQAAAAALLERAEYAVGLRPLKR